MNFSIVHLSDLHLGASGDLDKITGVLGLVPDLEPDLVVISGDLTLRARHGEFLAATQFARELDRTAPVYLIPGNHDVQWWRRPLWPWGAAAKYAKYRQHCGPALTPTMHFADAVVTGALTAHGIAWGSLSPRPRDLSVIGHLPKRETQRVGAIFREAGADRVRVLVMHHNLIPGSSTGRAGLVRSQTARRRIVETGADLVLCGHDHESRAEMIDGVVVSTAGTLSRRHPAEVPASFHRVAWEDDAIQIELFSWDPGARLFRRTETTAFSRARQSHEQRLPAGAV